MNLGSPVSGSRRPRGRRPAVPRGAHRPTHRLVVDRDAARAVAEQAARSLRPFRAARTARRRERALADIIRIGLSTTNQPQPARDFTFSAITSAAAAAVGDRQRGGRGARWRRRRGTKDPWLARMLAPGVEPERDLPPRPSPPPRAPAPPSPIMCVCRCRLSTTGGDTLETGCGYMLVVEHVED